MFFAGIEGIANSYRKALDAEIQASKRQSDALAAMTPYEREHWRQVQDHERQYRDKNAPRITHQSAGYRSSYSAPSGDGGATAFMGGLLIGSMLD